MSIDTTNGNTAAEAVVNLTTDNLISINQGSTNLAQNEPTIINIGKPLTDMIPEDARAVSDDVHENVEKYAKQGLLSPVSGMAQISNKFNGQIYACINVDEKNKRSVIFIQQYEDGSVSPEFSIRQSDLLMVAMGYQSQDAETVANSKKCLNRIVRMYLDVCDGRQLPDISAVILSLAEILGQLPVVKEKEPLTGEQLYSTAMSVISEWNSKTNNCINRYYRRGGYYLLDESVIKDIAEELHIATNRLLELLKKHNLLYLTGSCKGYQVKVPVDLDKDGNVRYGWRYCLLDLEYYSRLRDPMRAETAKELNPPLEREPEV